MTLTILRKRKRKIKTMREEYSTMNHFKKLKQRFLIYANCSSIFCNFLEFCDSNFRRKRIKRTNYIDVIYKSKSTFILYQCKRVERVKLIVRLKLNNIDKTSLL